MYPTVHGLNAKVRSVQFMKMFRLGFLLNVEFMDSVFNELQSTKCSEHLLVLLAVGMFF